MASTTSDTGECVCVCVCVRACACELLSHVETSHFITQLLYTLVSFGGTFFLDNMFTIYNLSSLCMLTANEFFFFGQVCLRLALEVQYLVDRFGIHQTTVSRTFNFFDISSFIDSAKDSTHFLLSASTISFPVCTTVLYSFFYLSWCCHTSFICTFCGELISTS